MVDASGPAPHDWARGLAVRHQILCAAVLALAVSTAQASNKTNAFSVEPDAVIETGDTFVQDGVRYRLFGVQACLPGTRVELASGASEDCGSISVTGLAGLMKDATPMCVEIGRSDWRGMPYVFTSCSMAIGGRSIELGTALIASGLAFASLTPEGAPVHVPYLAAEAVAQEQRQGIWSSEAFVHPARALLQLRD